MTPTPMQGMPYIKVRLRWLEAISGDLVAIEIASVCSIGIGRPAAGTYSAFILAAGSESGLVECGDRGPVRSSEADRTAIGPGSSFLLRVGAVSKQRVSA